MGRAEGAGGGEKEARAGDGAWEPLLRVCSETHRGGWSDSGGVTTTAIFWHSRRQDGKWVGGGEAKGGEGGVQGLGPWLPAPAAH